MARKPKTTTAALVHPVPRGRPADVALSWLSPAPPEIDSRADDKPKEIASLIASIKAHGLLQPLVVRKLDETYYYQVLAGRRRLTALQKLLGPDDLVAVVVVECDDREAAEASIAENVERVALHPVDEYNAYSRLAAQGMKPSDIAERFGVKLRWVEQRLQLAALAPELRAAWRAGKMDAEQAAALSSNPDHETQLKVWKERGSLRDNWSARPDGLRAAVRKGGVEQSDPRVKLVGMDAYLKDGGRVSSDLFADDQLLLDENLLDGLVEAKLFKRCAALVVEGWAWAMTQSQAEESGKYKYIGGLDLSPWMTEAQRAKLDDQKKAPTWEQRDKIENSAEAKALEDPKARASSGVIVSVGDDGAIEEDPLCVVMDAPARRPGALGDAPSEEDEEPENDAPAPEVVAQDAAADAGRVNHALKESLSEILTRAIAEQMQSDARVGFAALVAALRVGRRNSPLRIEGSPWEAIKALAPFEWDSDDDGFAPVFLVEAMAGVASSLRLIVISAIAASLLDLRDLRFDDRYGFKRARDEIVRTLTDALGAAAVEGHLQKLFADFAPEYFKRVNAADCKAALVEMDSPAKAPAKKGDLVEVCAKEAMRLKWLPPELRVAARPSEPAAEAAQ